MRLNAPAMMAAAVLVTAAALASARPAFSIEPDALPAAMWWQAPAPELSQNPLAALALPGTMRLAAEWAPLYVAKDGSRFEQERRSFRLTTPAARWIGAAEVGVGGGVARSGDTESWFGAQRPVLATSTIALAHRGTRGALAAAASGRDGRAGLALAGETAIGKAMVRAGWSRLPQTGNSTVQWDDVDVLAAGRWLDQRAHWEIAIAPTPALGLTIGQDALDRRTVHSSEIQPGDRLEPGLAWRASHASATLAAEGLQWRLAAEYGEGNESFRISRSGTPYATASGPVFNGLVTIEASSARRRLAVRAWSGRWNGDARAAVALWAFEDLAALSGTRRVAHSSATLEHTGIAIDRTPGKRGVDGGLALWSLAPRASYESWQATVMGVGHDDPSAGTTSLRSALALGARLAGTITWRGARMRLELVQWIPVQVVQETRRSEGGSSPPPPGNAGEPDGTQNGARGGSIVRMTLITG